MTPFDCYHGLSDILSTHLLGLFSPQHTSHSRPSMPSSAHCATRSFSFLSAFSIAYISKPFFLSVILTGFHFANPTTYRNTTPRRLLAYRRHDSSPGFRNSLTNSSPVYCRFRPFLHGLVMNFAIFFAIHSSHTAILIPLTLPPTSSSFSSPFPSTADAPPSCAQSSASCPAPTATNAIASVGNGTVHSRPVLAG